MGAVGDVTVLQVEVDAVLVQSSLLRLNFINICYPESKLQIQFALALYTKYVNFHRDSF